MCVNPSLRPNNDIIAHPEIGISNHKTEKKKKEMAMAVAKVAAAGAPQHSHDDVASLQKCIGTTH